MNAETPRDRTTTRRLFALVAVAVLWLLVAKAEAPAEPAPAKAASLPAFAEARDSARNQMADLGEAHSPLSSPELQHDPAALPPAKVLGNLRCRMATGRRAASDLAVVVLPHEAGARFAVVDGSGAVAGGTLPFMPNRYKLGRREDGTPLIGLAALLPKHDTFLAPEPLRVEADRGHRRRDKKPRPMDSPEPLRVYMGDHMVYETDKAWDFLVAPDASSFAVHEPLGGEASRLLVRSLDLGTERHFDLDTRVRPIYMYANPYSIGYSLDNTEIMFRPSHADALGRPSHFKALGRGIYWFYPVGDGSPRVVTVEEDVRSAVLVSSREGYFAGSPQDLVSDSLPEEHRSVWQITKRRFDLAGGTAAVWRRGLDVSLFHGTMFVSDNGKWLGVSGWDFHALNTRNGDTVFSYPKMDHLERQVASLIDAVGPDASQSDLGRLDRISFKGDRMMFFRVFGLRQCYGDGVRYRRCMRGLRKTGRFMTVYDVYDMKTITPDAPASFRAETYEDADCMPGDTRLGGLRDDNGTLVYFRGTGTR